MHSKHKENWEKILLKETTKVTKILRNKVKVMATLNQYFRDVLKKKNCFLKAGNYNQEIHFKKECIKLQIYISYKYETICEKCEGE